MHMKMNINHATHTHCAVLNLCCDDTHLACEMYHYNDVKSY